MNDTTKSERREAMLAKVRKLLAMGRGGANANESETAMRQANKIMAEYGIAEAEADMASIDRGEMIFGEAQCGPDGRAPEQGKVYRSMPRYAGILAVGVARFTDSIVGRKTSANGEMLYFRGEKEDVLLARWIFGVLIDQILLEQKRSGWTKRGDSNSFRVAAASELASRLKSLHAERQAMYRQAAQESQSRALVVVDRKALEVAQRFGKQKVRTSSSRVSSSGAHHAGREAGARINIPHGRPVCQANHARIGA